MDIGTHKKLLVQKLTHIQKGFDYAYSDFLFQMKLEVREKLENILYYEEII